MKVLVISSKYPPEYAGSGLRAHTTYKRLAARCPDLNFRVVCNSVEYSGNEDYIYENIRVRRVSSRLFRDLNRIPGHFLGRVLSAIKVYSEALPTFGILARERYDVIHVFGISASTVAAVLWARWRNIPLVLELVNAGATPEQNLPGLRAVWRPRFDRRTVVVAISNALREACLQMGLEKNVWVRPNPVDESRFYPSFEKKSALRRQYTPFGDNDRVVLTVAKFMPRKNQLFLVDVLARLPTRYKLVLSGPLVSAGQHLERDSEYVARIRARIAELGLEDRVLVRTEFVDTADYMKLADIYLAPHYSEGLGTPLLESLACAVPVVANRGEAAFREWIRDGHNGFTADLDPDAWARAIHDAERLSPQHMLGVSRETLNLASTSAVDSAYLSVLTTLATLPPDGNVDVEQVLAGVKR